jgi:hypothetical protein
MVDGLILLAFLGLLIAIFVVRVRRRMGIASTGKTWLTIITCVIALGLVLWASSTH